MKSRLAALLALGLAVLPADSRSVDRPVKVACVGDSITAGVGTTNLMFQSYPSQLRRMLGSGWEVRNFGNSGSTLGSQGDKPYRKQDTFEKALAFEPDMVVIMLGTNDTKPQNWQHKGRFAEDYQELIRAFRALAKPPRIYLCTPPYIPGAGNFGINEPTLQEQLPLIARVAKAERLPVIDNHAATKGQDAWFPDRVHPNNEGASALARTVYRGLTGKEFPAKVPEFFDSEWQGFKLREFEVAGRLCRVVIPEKPRAGNPWIWRTEFFGAFPSVDIALTKTGYHVAHMDVSGMYGAPAALDLMDRFYEHATGVLKLASKPVLEGFSRGGLYALNWAARHPQRVGSVYLDAPVCDFKSWPGAKGKGKPSPNDWANCLKAYGLTEEEALAYPGNPVDNLAPLATGKIPIIAVYGDADEDVLPEENILSVEQRYKALGGTIQLIAKPGVAHHPHSLSDPKPVVDFILAHAAGS